MKIIALYKVWSGEEWLEASVESIEPFVKKIIILTSDVSWIGGKENPSLPIVQKIAEKYIDKVVHLRHDEPNQIKHCMVGYEYIKKKFQCDYVQLIDSDELWDKINYEKAINFLKKHPDFDAYRTQMYTYIKSPFYRIEPPEPLKPVCFIKPNLPDMGIEPRGCGIHPFIAMPNVWWHHFVFVRYHFNKVLEKLIQSHVSEKQSYESMDKWIPEVWNKLPDWNKQIFPHGFHPAIGFGTNWKSIKKVELKDLPSVLQGYDYILRYGE